MISVEWYLSTGAFFDKIADRSGADGYDRLCGRPVEIIVTEDAFVGAEPNEDSAGGPCSKGRMGGLQIL